MKEMGKPNGDIKLHTKHDWGIFRDFLSWSDEELGGWTKTLSSNKKNGGVQTQ